MSRAQIKHRLLRARAKDRQLGFDLTVADVEKVLSSQVCAICGQPFGKTGDGTLTVDRINHLQGYLQGNIQAAHKRCNQRKAFFENPRLRSRPPKYKRRRRGKDDRAL